MNTPSTTVQTAQQLLAEREVVGLAKYGTTVDRTDLTNEQWLQHLIEELADGLLYALRSRDLLRTAAEDQLIAEREAMEAGELAATPVFALNLYTSPIAEVQPSPAEDPERAAYLRRWEGAPAEATHLAQDGCGDCAWWDGEPRLRSFWGSRYFESPCGCYRGYAGHNLLGSVRCEPRPEPRPGVEG